jgi:hypothetical protein
MRAQLIIFLAELVHLALLRATVGRGWVGRFLFHGAMHPFVSSVMFRMACFNAFWCDPEFNPPQCESR